MLGEVFYSSLEGSLDLEKASGRRDLTSFGARVIGGENHSLANEDEAPFGLPKMASRKKDGLPNMSESEFPVLGASRDNTNGKASLPAEHLTSGHTKSGSPWSTQVDPIGRSALGGNESRLVGSRVGDGALAPISSNLIQTPSTCEETRDRVSSEEPP